MGPWGSKAKEDRRKRQARQGKAEGKSGTRGPGHILTVSGSLAVRRLRPHGDDRTPAIRRPTRPSGEDGKQLLCYVNADPCLVLDKI